MKITINNNAIDSFLKIALITIPSIKIKVRKGYTK